MKALYALAGGYFVASFGVHETMVAFGVVYLAFTLSPLVIPAWRGANAPPRAAAAPQSPG